MKTALLVIDVQQAMIDEHPARMDEFMLNLKLLIDTAHQSGTEVIYVRHDGGEGDVLAYGTSGWQLEKSLHPRAEERVFDKRFGSAFRQTGLHNYLNSRGIGQSQPGARTGEDKIVPISGLCNSRRCQQGSQKDLLHLQLPSIQSIKSNNAIR